MRIQRMRIAFVLITGLGLSAAAEAQQQAPGRKVDTARVVYHELIDLPDRRVPKRLLEDARCVAVIPNVVKGAFFAGGRHGRGVMSCRDESGTWSPLSFVKLSGGSFGLQIGGQSTDLVLFFMTERGVRSLLKSKFVLGGDASVAAGPLGRTAEIATDLRLGAEIYAYAKSRGVFAGLSVEGAVLAPDQKWIARYYGRRVWPEELLFDHEAPSQPAESTRFLAELP